MSDAGPIVLRSRAAWTELLASSARDTVERRLPAYVAARRWFRSKSRAIERVRITRTIALGEPMPTIVCVVAGELAGGGTEEYVLPVTACFGDEAAALRTRAPHVVIAEIRADAGAPGILCDALGVPEAQRALHALFERAATVDAQGGSLRFRAIGGFATRGPAEPRSLEAEQSNTSIVFGDELVLKVVRRLEPGVSADLEMGEFLTRAAYAHAPAVAGALELVVDGAPATVGIVHRFVHNQGDAWHFFAGPIAAFVESQAGGAAALPPEHASLVRLLARRVAEMHRALASRDDLPNFRPEPLGRDERAVLAKAAVASLRRVAASLAARRASLAAEAAAAADELVAREEKLEERVGRFVDLAGDVRKARVHGDLHLGQVLFTGDDFMIIDFEGEPARPLAERKAKRSPMADVAGMLRSLHYAAVAALRSRSAPTPAQRDRAEAWHAGATEAFLDAYFACAGSAALVPDDPDARSVVLDFYLLEKCLYEVQYELDNRPDWVAIPILGLAHLLKDDHAR
jgi:trehalose synthase-fused probable maltokinase